jgi:hypothetical protein
VGSVSQGTATPASSTLLQLRAPQSHSFGASLRCSLAHFTTSMAFPYAALAQPLATASSALFVTATVNVRDEATGGTAALVVLGLLAVMSAAVPPMHWVAVVRVNQPLPSSPPVVFFNRIEASTRPPPQGSRKWQAMSLREQVLLMLHGPMTYPYPDF